MAERLADRAEVEAREWMEKVLSSPPELESPSVTTRVGPAGSWYLTLIAQPRWDTDDIGHWCLLVRSASRARREVRPEDFPGAVRTEVRAMIVSIRDQLTWLRQMGEDPHELADESLVSEVLES